MGLLRGISILKDTYLNWGWSTVPGTREAFEMTSHVLCDCEELAVLRFRHLGHYVLKASDFANISISMVLHIVQSMTLLKPYAKGCTKDSKQSRCQVHCSAHPNLLYSTPSLSCPHIFLITLLQKPSVYLLPLM